MNDLTVGVGGGLLNVRVGAIIARGGRILMVGNDRADYLYSVGGRIKFGESAEEAVIREVYEETGCKMGIEKLGFIHECFFIGDDGCNQGRKIYEVSFYFYMDVPEDFEPVCGSSTADGHHEYLRWIDPRSEEKYYPAFFRSELGQSRGGAKHIVTREY